MPDVFELSCPRCRWSRECGPAATIEWLRTVQMVRRDAVPEAELLGELLRAAGPKLKCPGCGGAGLAVGEAAEENDEEWGMARKCQGCGRPIPRSRLEVFPNTTLCVACQSGAERGDDADPAEYCPKCGNVMRLKQSRAAGVTRYVMACPVCRG